LQTFAFFYFTCNHVFTHSWSASRSHAGGLKCHALRIIHDYFLVKNLAAKLIFFPRTVFYWFNIYCLLLMQHCCWLFVFNLQGAAIKRPHCAKCIIVASVLLNFPAKFSSSVP